MLDTVMYERTDQRFSAAPLARRPIGCAYTSMIRKIRSRSRSPSPPPLAARSRPPPPPPVSLYEFCVPPHPAAADWAVTTIRRFTAGPAAPLTAATDVRPFPRPRPSPPDCETRAGD